MIALAALLLGCAVFVLIPGSPEPRLQRLVPHAARRQRSLTARQLQLGAALLVAIGCVSIFGVFPGVPLAIGGALLVTTLMGRLESTDSRRNRLALERQLPDALDVLKSILEAGAPWAAEAFSSSARRWSRSVSHISPALGNLFLAARSYFAA